MALISVEANMFTLAHQDILVDWIGFGYLNYLQMHLISVYENTIIIFDLENILKIINNRYHTNPYVQEKKRPSVVIQYSQIEINWVSAFLLLKYRSESLSNLMSLPEGFQVDIFNFLLDITIWFSKMPTHTKDAQNLRHM